MTAALRRMILTASVVAVGAVWAFALLGQALIATLLGVAAAVGVMLAG